MSRRDILGTTVGSVAIVEGVIAQVVAQGRGLLSRFVLFILFTDFLVLFAPFSPTFVYTLYLGVLKRVSGANTSFFVIVEGRESEEVLVHQKSTRKNSFLQIPFSSQLLSPIWEEKQHKRGERQRVWQNRTSNRARRTNPQLER
jgi:hypothetical protein